MVYFFKLFNIIFADHIKEAKASLKDNTRYNHCNRYSMAKYHKCVYHKLHRCNFRLKRVKVYNLQLKVYYC